MFRGITGSHYMAYIATWLETVESTYIIKCLLHTLLLNIRFITTRGGNISLGRRPSEICPPRVVINHDIQRRSVQ